MKILHILPSVSPKEGGPIEYARVMAEAHAEMGHSSGFVTLDHPDDPEVAAFPFEVFASGSRHGFPFNVYLFSKTVAKVAGDFDVAVVHGLWNSASIGGYQALRAAKLPWVTFPHGMLDPYFRKTKPVKHWVKQMYWLLWQGRMLSHAAAVLFTCEEERLKAQKAFWGHRTWQERVVAFCAADQKASQNELAEGRDELRRIIPALSNRQFLLFLSRIHPKKACDTLIEAFARIAEETPELDLVFAGPDQTGWQEELVKISATLGIGDRVHWPGMISGATKAAAFADARAFVLPSHQENFGLVVAEALSMGTPVLISEEVDIWREIVADGAGLARSDTLSGTTDLLATFLDLDVEGESAMRAAAVPCYEARFSVGSAARDLLVALEDAKFRN